MFNRLACHLFSGSFVVFLNVSTGLSCINRFQSPQPVRTFLTDMLPLNRLWFGKSINLKNLLIRAAVGLARASAMVATLMILPYGAMEKIRRKKEITFSTKVFRFQTKLLKLCAQSILTTED